MAKDPVFTESYMALRNALIAVESDMSALQSLLFLRPDGGAKWVQTAYCELRRLLVQGNIVQAERIGGIIGKILSIQDQGMDDELAESSIHRESMRWVCDGISSILDQDNLTGIKHLTRLTEAVYTNDSLQWVAWYWLAKAAADEGDLKLAGRASGEAMTLAESLGPQARGMSMCQRSEVEFLLGEQDTALSHLTVASDMFREIDNRRGMATALLTQARQFFQLDRKKEGYRAVKEAIESDQDWEDPAVFLSQLLLISGKVDEAREAIAPFSDPEGRSPEVDQQLRLVDLLSREEEKKEVVAEYLQLKSLPPSEESVKKIQVAHERNPGFLMLRDLLAWSLVKIGLEEKAAEHFKAMAALTLPPELQSSVLLGLGCLANRKYRHRQPSARLRAATSPDGHELVETLVDDDLEIPVFEVTPPPSAGPAEDGDDILVIEAMSALEDLDQGSAPKGLDAVVEFQESRNTTGQLDISEALDASFEFTVDAKGPETQALDDIQIDFADVKAELEEEAPPPVDEEDKVTAQASSNEMLTANEPARAASNKAATVVPSSSSKSSPKGEAKAAFTGLLQLFAVPDLLDFLESSRRTGTLLITSKMGIGAVHLRSGKITGAASPKTPSLGEMLVDTKAIDEEQLLKAIKDQKENNPDRLLGALMVEKEIVTQSELQKTLVEQVKGALMEMVVWTEGRFAFEPDKRGEATDEIAVELDTRGMLLDVLRQHDEQNRT